MDPCRTQTPTRPARLPTGLGKPGPSPGPDAALLGDPEPPPLPPRLGLPVQEADESTAFTEVSTTLQGARDAASPWCRPPLPLPGQGFSMPALTHNSGHSLWSLPAPWPIVPPH